MQQKPLRHFKHLRKVTLSGSHLQNHTGYSKKSPVEGWLSTRRLFNNPEKSPFATGSWWFPDYFLNSLERPWIRHEGSSGSQERASTHTTSPHLHLRRNMPRSLSAPRPCFETSIPHFEGTREERTDEGIHFIFHLQVRQVGEVSLFLFPGKKSLGYKVLGNITSIYYTKVIRDLYTESTGFILISSYFRVYWHTFYEWTGVSKK